jgi:lysophospholipase L1-like esterase
VEDAIPVNSVRTPIRTYVAVGDSFTEGVADANPDGSLRGWADLVAERLAALQPGFRYANLAVRGKLMRQISADQVPKARAMGADLVSLVGGLNDVGRPGCDIEAVCAEMERCAALLAETAGRLLLFHPIDFTVRMPSMARFAGRVRRLMDSVERIRQRHGAVVVDLSEERVFDDPRLFAADRLHLAAEGHRRIAEAVLEALGHEPSFDWRAPLPPVRRKGALAKKWADIVWFVAFVAPWIKRRLTRRSSGDSLPPKRPELAPLAITASQGAVTPIRLPVCPGS